ncbi:hypothetical protein AA100600_2385 [Gluconobacter thailandicus F149-1 = NBRC 100600]|nr:hypothetical protein AA100600_2385 [Gluconobacter thailandicus F149-1 = NBRC 100600]
MILAELESLNAGLRLQFSVPVQIITPAFVQIVGWKGSPVFLKKATARLIRFSVRVHADFFGEAGAFEKIAGAAGSYHILPGCFSAFGAGNDMIKSQFMRWQSVMAVLAGEVIPQEHIKASEGWFSG